MEPENLDPAHTEVAWDTESGDLQGQHKWIAASRALIGANLSDDGRTIKEVFVIRDERHYWQDDLEKVPEKWREAHITMGACFIDWMKPGLHAMTPEWVFSEFMIAYGFENSIVAEQAVAEFSRIAECKWARKMKPVKPNDPKIYWSM